MSADDMQGVLANLTAERAILRSAAFHELVQRVWREDDHVHGKGLVHDEAGRVAPHLIDLLRRTDAPDRHRLAFLLGLLAEAEGVAGADEGAAANLRAFIRTGVPRYLDILDDSKNSPALSEKRLVRAIVYLLAHFREDKDAITARVAAACGNNSRESVTVAAVFDSAEHEPKRSKMILMYLGAEACASAGENQLARCAGILACPSCRGALAFHAADVSCVQCQHRYAYRGDILDLVIPGTTDPEEYSEEVVKIYETQSRPRFVQVMAEDWEGGVTVEREERYLARHLEPVDGPVLDVACGAGGWTALVAKLVGARRVIAVDYSYAMLVACEKVVPDALFVRGSSSELPIANGVLGGANCSDTLQALPDPEKAIAEIARCLRPGAPFTCFTFRSAPPPYLYFQHKFPPNPRRVFSAQHVIRSVERAGLDVTDIGGPNRALFFTARKPRSPAP